MYISISISTDVSIVCFFAFFLHYFFSLLVIRWRQRDMIFPYFHTLKIQKTNEIGKQ